MYARLQPYVGGMVMGLAITIIVFWIAASVLLVFLSGASAHSHDGIVYPSGCCNSAATAANGDCAPIDDLYVREEADGYHIDLPAGGHPRLVKNEYHVVIPYADPQIRPPLDGNYHFCLGNEGSVRHCFFPKPGAV